MSTNNKEITPISVSKVDLIFTNRYSWSKREKFVYYGSICVDEQCQLTEVIKLSSEDYYYFRANLLSNSHDWLKGKGGIGSTRNFGKPFDQLCERDKYYYKKYSYTICVLVYADDLEPILISPKDSRVKYVAKLVKSVKDQLISTGIL